MDARTILEAVDVECLACSVGAMMATELERLSGGQLSHDQITRALAGPADGARELWAKVKPLVRAAEREAAGQGVLIIDDTILAKPHSDESEIVGWHFDHTDNRAVKGINLLTLFWQGASTRLPVATRWCKSESPRPASGPSPRWTRTRSFGTSPGKPKPMRFLSGPCSRIAGLPARRTWNWCIES